MEPVPATPVTPVPTAPAQFKSQSELFNEELQVLLEKYPTVRLDVVPKYNINITELVTAAKEEPKK